MLKRASLQATSSLTAYPKSSVPRSRHSMARIALFSGIISTIWIKFYRDCFLQICHEFICQRKRLHIKVVIIKWGDFFRSAHGCFDRSSWSFSWSFSWSRAGFLSFFLVSCFLLKIPTSVRIEWNKREREVEWIRWKPKASNFWLDLDYAALILLSLNWKQDWMLYWGRGRK